MRKRNCLILAFISFVLIFNPLIGRMANAQEKEPIVYGPKSDVKDNNTVALLNKIADNGKETIALLTEIRDLLKEQNEKLEKK